MPSSRVIIPNLLLIGDEEITVSTVAIGPTAAQVTDAVVMAIFQCVEGTATQRIRFRINNDPVAAGTNGELAFGVDNNEAWEVWGHDNILNAKMIRVDAADVQVAVQYFGRAG